MTSRFIKTAALTLLLASPVVGSAQDLASQVVGVWKRTSAVHKVQATGETTKPEGENPSGMFILSRGGHFVWIFTADGRKPPTSRPPTDAELVYLSRTGSAGGGTYKVNGDKLTLAYTDSSNQYFAGTERPSQTAQVSGKVMTWTSAPFKNAEGKDVVAIFTYERLE